jgi:transporter family protein
MFTQPWLMYAFAAAVAAALTNLFGRIGVERIDSTFATTVRSGVMLLFLVLVCTYRGLWHHSRNLNSLGLSMIVLSGLAGATSWLMGFKALSMAEGTVWRVGSIDKLSVPIAALLAFFFFKERPLPVNWLGLGLIALGGALSAWKP